MKEENKKDELRKAKRRLREGKNRVSLMVFLGRSKDKINAKRLDNYNTEQKIKELEKTIEHDSKGESKGVI